MPDATASDGVGTELLVLGHGAHQPLFLCACVGADVFRLMRLSRPVDTAAGRWSTFTTSPYGCALQQTTCQWTLCCGGAQHLCLSI